MDLRLAHRCIAMFSCVFFRAYLGRCQGRQGSGMDPNTVLTQEKRDSEHSQ